ncbi:flagellar assembly protein FliW [Cellulomonas sp. NPDC089187]|uniref:flagellar assembly protein FliW n=1 Tax=Cellulomonas sp. NPDC089187 TaxID=3154970 RepID=UPI0034414C56
MTTTLMTTALPTALHLRTPMPGLDEHTAFEVSALDETGTLFALRSAPEGARPVRLFVVDPEPYFPDYAPQIGDTLHTLLGAEHLRVLVVVRPAQGTQPPTANLLAPLVVDPRTGAAAQTVLTEDWPLRAPLGRP